MKPFECIHVAVGVVFNEQQKILVALRHTHLHQGGKWEFPGGKIEQGETVVAALTRELQEEVAIDIEQAEPLLQVQHDYADKSVLLDVYIVNKFSGQAHGREGQAIRWVTIAELMLLDIPAANQAIVDAITRK